jgi:hypothetical protein
MDKFLAQPPSLICLPTCSLSISFCERHVFPFRCRIPVSYRSVSLSLYHYPSSHLPPPALIPQGQYLLLPFLKSPWLRDRSQSNQVTHFCNPVSSTHTCVYSVFINFSLPMPTSTQHLTLRPLAWVPSRKAVRSYRPKSCAVALEGHMSNHRAPGKVPDKKESILTLVCRFSSHFFCDNGQPPIARTFVHPSVIGEVDRSDTEQHHPHDGLYIWCWGSYHTTVDCEGRSRDR